MPIRSSWAGVWHCAATASVVFASSFAGTMALAAVHRQPDVVDFNRDVRPILSDVCFRCHGPDAPARKASLRLDTEAGAKADLGGYQAVKPGDEQASELIKRIVHSDPDERMPPADAPRQLTSQQVQVLRLWIKQGAPWAAHWAFTPPKPPPVPAVKRADWPRNDIDRYVLSKLEQEGLTPATDAAPTTLLRRLSLDLTGLPPTLQEQVAFARGRRSLGAKVWPQTVDRLLASNAYAEHMAAQWMSAARYADTNGYQKDDVRQMWRWRDWVLNAFAQNMPFDKFTVAQTAGDLLPDRTLDDQIATGFHRNHRTNSEGGIIDAEFRAEYLADRVDTTATVWLGLTLGCARCHDHKYDPLSQRDYYRFSAFFASVPERGRVVGSPNAAPFVLAPTPPQALRLEELRSALAAAERALNILRPSAVWLSRGWNSAPAAQGPPLNDIAFVGDGLRVVVAQLTPLTSSVGLVGLDDARFSGDQPFSLCLAGRFDNAQGTLVAQQETDVDKKGWRVATADGHLHVELANRWLDDGIRIKTLHKLPSGTHNRLVVTYDGSRHANGLTVWLDGARLKMLALLDSFVNGANSSVPIEFSRAGQPQENMVRELRLYDRVLSHDEIAWLAVPQSLAELANGKTLTTRQEAKLVAGWWELGSAGEHKTAWKNAVAARHALSTFTASLPTTMVLQEGPLRPTYLLTRGEYDKPAERVFPGIPALWNPANMNNRLALAKWLVDPSNPLTARVFVNRMWQMMFGTGIVATSDNFGAQGEAPSHPELLDHLACTFVQSGWDVKGLLKRMALSRTYRQSSNTTPLLQRRDPNNRLLARAVRLRLPAEVIRDQALAAAGLLHQQLGGASVKLPQPFGVWEDNGGPSFVAAAAPDKYRRSLYAFWKRTAPPPSLATFDASSRESCAVRPMRTNTPLQALAMMNDPVQIEAAEALAQAARQEGSNDQQFVAGLFKSVLARLPSNLEGKYLRQYRDAEQRRLLNVLNTEPLQARHAADVLTAMLVLNLDETINRE